MKNDLVLRVSNITKRYKVYSSPWSMLKEWLTFGLRSHHSDYWALKGISFDVFKGEFVGIIGTNGAGKSTLLRIVTDALPPTEGNYTTYGRILSILELSGGSDHDLTGRENVIRNAQLLNLPEGYVQDRMEQIKDFSELGEFFEQPLRTYSSGMKSRLAFSMFAFLDMEILILDEVLAVGDIFFKQKCFERLAELIENQTAIILVTHNLNIVRRYCKRVIVLNRGEKIYDGHSVEAVRLFMELRGRKQAEAVRLMELDDTQVGDLRMSKKAALEELDGWPSNSSFQYTTFPGLVGKQKVKFLQLGVLNDQGEPSLEFKQGDSMNIYCKFRLKMNIETPIITVEIRDEFNLLVHSKNTVQNHASLPAEVLQGDVILYFQSILLNIAPGTYVINIYGQHLVTQADRRKKTGKQAGAVGKLKRLWRLNRAFAINVQPRYNENLQTSHGGVCDLPGESMLRVVSD